MSTSNDTLPFPKTLVLSRSVPPAVTGSATVVGSLAKQFTRDEMVIVGAFEPGRPKVTWSSEWPRIYYAMIWSSRFRGERWLRRIQLSWLVLFSLWTLISQRCQVILAIYPDEVYLLAAYVVARIAGKPLFAYFHNTFLENHQDSRLAHWLQPRIFHYARHVFVMSEGLERLYQRNYPGLKCSPLVHTFNEPISAYVPRPTLRNPVQLCFAGNVNASCSDAASRMAQMVQELEEVHLTLLTGTRHDVLERVGFVGPRVTVETVSRDRLLQYLQQADILLLPHGFTSSLAQEEIKTIFPTKVIEYLTSGRPILAHLPSDCFLAEFLRLHNCALIVDEPTVPALKRGLITLQCDADLRVRLVRNALKAAERFHAPRVAMHLRNIIISSHSDQRFCGGSDSEPESDIFRLDSRI